MSFREDWVECGYRTQVYKVYTRLFFLPFERLWVDFTGKVEYEIALPAKGVLALTKIC